MLLDNKQKISALLMSGGIVLQRKPHFNVSIKDNTFPFGLFEFGFLRDAKMLSTGTGSPCNTDVFTPHLKTL